jgi:hypothetical protein
VGHLR